MIHMTTTERIVNLSNLYFLRHVNWPWMRRILSIYHSYLGMTRLPASSLLDCPLQNLRAQLDTGWVGALLLDGPKHGLAGIVLGRVEYYLDSVSVYVLAESVRVTRPGDEAQVSRRLACLQDSMLQQVVWQHLHYGEEPSSDALPRQRHTIFCWRHQGTVTERHVWDATTQTLREQ